MFFAKLRFFHEMPFIPIIFFSPSLPLFSTLPPFFSKSLSKFSLLHSNHYVAPLKTFLPTIKTFLSPHLKLFSSLKYTWSSGFAYKSSGFALISKTTALRIFPSLSQFPSNTRYLLFGEVETYIHTEKIQPLCTFFKLFL